MDWIRMEPLFPGRSIELNAHFEAAYQYGDHLDADLVYLNLNPNDRLICRVSAGHSGAGFAPCSRVTNFTSVTGAEVYMPAKELERGRLAANASAPLHIQHPEFDIADARLRAGVKEGPFGYSRQTHRWILLNSVKNSTLLVGKTGAIKELPGDWVNVLISLNSNPDITLVWKARSQEEAENIRVRLNQAGIEANAFIYKARTSPSVLLVNLRPENVGQLAKIMCEMGTALEESNVIRQCIDGVGLD